MDGVSTETSVTLAGSLFYLILAGGAAAGTKVSTVTGRSEHKDGGLLGSEHAGQKNARGPEEATEPRDARRPWGSLGPPSHQHPSLPGSSARANSSGPRDPQRASAPANLRPPGRPCHAIGYDACPSCLVPPPIIAALRPSAPLCPASHPSLRRPDCKGA